MGMALCTQGSEGLTIMHSLTKNEHLPIELHSLVTDPC